MLYTIIHINLLIVKYTSFHTQIFKYTALCINIIINGT